MAMTAMEMGEAIRMIQRMIDTVGLRNPAIEIRWRGNDVAHADVWWVKMTYEPCGDENHRADLLLESGSDTEEDTPEEAIIEFAEDIRLALRKALGEKP